MTRTADSCVSCPQSSNWSSGIAPLDGLDDAAAVAQLQEVQLALAAHVVEPALDEHVLANVLAEALDRDGAHAAVALVGHGVEVGFSLQASLQGKAV
jgi:hypothetical protein